MPGYGENKEVHYITIGSTVREGKENKHPFREIILFLRKYQYISNDNKMHNVELIWNSINILENEVENLTIPMHKNVFPHLFPNIISKCYVSSGVRGKFKEKWKGIPS